MSVYVVKLFEELNIMDDLICPATQITSINNETVKGI
jgi:hypothetical protein